ncbi:hypothetical protein [Neomesorhizobium albiziae]|uniref:hypothetical protein n=1 Tax=Neomesorhizobium albiziae TaxID=335020 RepID=UPI00122C7A48|nr:hypothetical protein [Mesorhizobium albiziae]
MDSHSRDLTPVIPDDIQELLSPPPLIATEDPSRYRDFMVRFALEFDPQSISEWFLVNDLVNVHWEISRYRRAKATLIRLACPALASKLIEDSDFGFEKFSHGDFKSQPVVVTKGRSREIGQQLAGHGLTVEDVFDSALIENLDEVERFDKMIETMENRREKLFREFRAHRSLNPETAKKKANAIVDQFGPTAT